MKPFRWNLHKKEQLGSLLTQEETDTYAAYNEQLIHCAALVVARSNNSRLIFVGRSPENIFDYLSGVLHQTSHENKLGLLNISNRFHQISRIKNELPDAYAALQQHFTELEVAPKQIIASPDGVCFSDLVASGGTFENIFTFIQQWSQTDKADFPAVVSKLRFVGITQKSKNSPNKWRWQQHANWVKAHNKLQVKNVSIPEQLWDYLGNRQVKVAKTNYPERWADEKILLPPRDETNLKALKQAYQIYSLGLSDKKNFAEKLTQTQEIKAPWLRDLINQLKN